MALVIMVLGFVVAAVIIGSIPRIPGNLLKGAAAAGALVVLFLFILGSSVRFVPETKVGIVIKNIALRDLPSGQIIATNGEKGPQAEILAPGWHPWYWPLVYDLEFTDVTEIKGEHVGLIETTDGVQLPQTEIYANEWQESEMSNMLKAEYFLTSNNGYKGPQASILTPGKYRLNTRLYKITEVPITDIRKATVGVVKSNIGKDAPAATDEDESRLVEKGYKGIWKQPLNEQKIYLHSGAYEVTHISLKRQVVKYVAATASESRQRTNEENEITVRSSDGFTFPVDVRIEYLIKPSDAPKVVSVLEDDQDTLRAVLNSAVRAIFRNNAEQVKALDYVQQRSLQESQSLNALSEEMTKVGVTVTAVRIGDIGNEKTLGNLLKTQTDREIALQEQKTFQEQQRAAEQKKALTRTEQEAEEEKRLATAQYEVKIAEENKQKKIIEAGAEAEAIKIKAEAQAEAFRVIAEQIGKGNAALVELLKIIGDNSINITPRVMVIGNSDTNGSANNAETTALIGTMLDSMLNNPESDSE